MVRARIFLWLSFLLVSHDLLSQQLLILRREKVLKRFKIGDTFSCKKNRREMVSNERIVGITDTTLLTQNDTISFYKIAKINIGERQEKNFRLRSSAVKLITFGLLVPLGDFITVSVVQNKDYEFNRGVGLSCGAVVLTGVILVVATRPWIKLNRRNKLSVVTYGSLFYEP
jgi:hypothetical protein